MALLPGTIDLGKFRVVYEEERERPSNESDGYLLQQRAIIRLNEALVKLEQQADYSVYCDDENFKKQHGKRPSPLQYFIASIGFCMFSQFKRLAAKAEVALDDLEMDLRMTYDLTGRFPMSDVADAAQGLRYHFTIKSNASLPDVI
ncbi:MAG TPA: OsmC family protein, partial [Candidatus Binatia bacterium]